MLVQYVEELLAEHVVVGGDPHKRKIVLGKKKIPSEGLAYN